jgi:hypothetical protein
MRASFLCLAVLFLVPHVDAAPAPEPGRAAKAKLAALKKKLPDILDEWKKTRVCDLQVEDGTTGKVVARGSIKLGKPELRVLRRVGPERAKVVILFPYYELTERKPRQDVLLTIFLSYQDGCWTTERSESFGKHNAFFDSTDSAFLMLAIDEAAEK